jgi:hypothetical protein
MKMIKLIKWYFGLFVTSLGGGGGDGGDGGAAQQQAEEAKKAAFRSQINSLFGVGDGADAARAKSSIAAEEAGLDSAFRTHYTTEGKKQYDEALRKLTFNAANTGHVNDSAFADEKARLDEANALGGTRISDAVQQAINNYRNNNDSVRNNSIALVNAGSGADAIAAANAGLQQSLQGAKSATKQDLFSDLFANTAFAKAAGDASGRNAQIAALFSRKGNAVGGYTPTAGTTVAGA